MSDVVLKSPAKTGPRPSDKWIPWYFVIFFALMLSALIPMAYFAVHTLPGIVTDNAYEKGLAYNKLIEAGDKAAALGWNGSITVMTGADAQTRVSYRLKDKQGEGLLGADVHAWLVRPNQSGMDRDLILQSVGGGVYEGVIKLPTMGVWDARVSATKNNDNFQSEKRVVTP